MNERKDLTRRAGWGCVGFFALILVWVLLLRVLDAWFIATVVGVNMTLSPLRSFTVLFGWLAGGTLVTRAPRYQFWLWITVAVVFSLIMGVYSASQVPEAPAAAVDPGMVGLSVFGYMAATCLASGAVGLMAGQKLIASPDQGHGETVRDQQEKKD
jgi:hypothetical protein